MIKFYEKHKDFLALSLKPKTRALFLEGTIRSSKTVMMIQSFFYKVWNSDAQLHMIAGRDFDTINNNLLTNDMGMITMFPNHCKLMADSIGGYYVRLISPKGIKKILLVGFDNRSKWKKILGLSIENIIVDEANIADKQFIDECWGRQVSFDNPLTIWTLNGDIPEHFIYQEYINRANIVGNAPASIRADMDKASKQKGWYYMHWKMQDNPVMTPSKIKEASSIYPIGSYYYTIKILGERGAPGKLIYIDYLDRDRNIKNIDLRKYPRYGIGVDIGASRAKNSFALVGFDSQYSNVGIIDKMEFKELGYQSKKEKLIAFVRDWLARGCNIEYVSIDSAEANFIKDIQTEFKRLGLPPIIPSYKATIKERIDLVIILISSGRLVFNNTKEGLSCYDAFTVCKWVDGKEGQEREDLNLPHNDIIDSVEYALTRHMNALLKAAKSLGHKEAA